jgi:hypothetical protein
MFSQGADGAVHGGDLGVALAQDLALRAFGGAAGFVRGEFDLLRVFRGQVVVEREILRQAAVRLMRRAEPDDLEERLPGFLSAFDDLNGLAMRISELSPLKSSGGPPLRESEGFISKKLSCERHS